MAELLTISVNTLKSYETGRRHPSPTDLEDMIQGARRRPEAARELEAEFAFELQKQAYNRRLATADGPGLVDVVEQIRRHHDYILQRTGLRVQLGLQGFRQELEELDRNQGGSVSSDPLAQFRQQQKCTELRVLIERLERQNEEFQLQILTLEALEQQGRERLQALLAQASG